MRDDLVTAFVLQGKIWHHLSPDDRKKRGWFPNHSIRHNSESVIQLASVRSGPRKDWSINRRALEEHAAFQDDGRIARAYVTLWNSDMTFVARDTAKNVLERLRKERELPRDGDYGAYWWVNANFELIGRKKNRQQKKEDRVYVDSQMALVWP